MQFLRTGSSSGCGPIPKPVAGAAQQTLGECPSELPFRCRDGSCAKDWTFCTDRLPRMRRTQRRGFAGDVVGGPHFRYPPGRARVPWMDTYGGGGEKTPTPPSGCDRRTPAVAGLSAVDAIKFRQIAGAVIRTRRGTVVTTGSTQARTFAGFAAKVGSIPMTRGG